MPRHKKTYIHWADVHIENLEKDCVLRIREGHHRDTGAKVYTWRIYRNPDMSEETWWSEAFMRYGEYEHSVEDATRVAKNCFQSDLKAGRI